MLLSRALLEQHSNICSGVGSARAVVLFAAHVLLVLLHQGSFALVCSSTIGAPVWSLHHDASALCSWPIAGPAALPPIRIRLPVLFTFGPSQDPELCPPFAVRVWEAALQEMCRAAQQCEKSQHNEMEQVDFLAAPDRQAPQQQQQEQQQEQQLKQLASAAATSSANEAAAEMACNGAAPPGSAGPGGVAASCADSAAECTHWVVQAQFEEQHAERQTQNLGAAVWPIFESMFRSLTALSMAMHQQQQPAPEDVQGSEAWIPRVSSKRVVCGWVVVGRQAGCRFMGAWALSPLGMPWGAPELVCCLGFLGHFWATLDEAEWCSSGPEGAECVLVPSFLGRHCALKKVPLNALVSLSIPCI